MGGVLRFPNILPQPGLRLSCFRSPRVDIFLQAALDVEREKMERYLEPRHFVVAWTVAFPESCFGVSNVRARDCWLSWLTVKWTNQTLLLVGYVPMDMTCDLGSLLHLRKTSANVGVLALASSGGKNRTSWPDCWTFAAPGWKWRSHGYFGGQFLSQWVFLVNFSKTIVIIQ